MPQWQLAGPNEKGYLKVPTGVDVRGKPFHGSSTDLRYCMPFDVAVAHAQRLGYGIGFVLTAQDPYCCIDLDVKDAQTDPVSTPE